METVSRDVAARRRALEYAGPLNTLKACARNHLTAAFQGVIKRCMNPGANIDLQRNDLQLRMEAMDVLFAARERVAEGCLDFSLQGLEPKVKLRKTTDAEPALEDAQTALAGWTFITHNEHRHESALAPLARRIAALAECIGRPLDPYCLHPRSLYEAFRRQARALPLDVAGQLVVCELYAGQLEGMLGKFYREANQTLEKLKLRLKEDLPPKQRDERLYEAIAAISVLFTSVERHSNLSETARRALLSLRPALALIAYSDLPSFESSEHPAKQMVSSLVMRWQGLYDVNDPRHHALMTAVEKLAHGSHLPE